MSDERDELQARIAELTEMLTGLLRECNENEEHMDEDEPQFSARDIRRRLTSAALAAGTTESEAL